MLNCPELPLFKVNNCFEQLILDFGFALNTNYQLHFSDYMDNIHILQTSSDNSGKIAINKTTLNEGILNINRSPFSLTVKTIGCNVQMLDVCGESYESVLIEFEQQTGDSETIITIPCC